MPCISGVGNLCFAISSLNFSKFPFSAWEPPGLAISPGWAARIGPRLTWDQISLKAHFVLTPSPHAWGPPYIPRNFRILTYGIYWNHGWELVPEGQRGKWIASAANVVFLWHNYVKLDKLNGIDILIMDDSNSAYWQSLHKMYFSMLWVPYTWLYV